MLLDTVVVESEIVCSFEMLSEHILKIIHDTTVAIQLLIQRINYSQRLLQLLQFSEVRFEIIWLLKKLILKAEEEELD